jgi:DNA-binding transcriptional ArsR family regulator
MADTPLEELADAPLGPPLASRTISDVEALKAISDPVRIRILEMMVQVPNEDWTVKRIAKALGVGPTKLYHHVRILEDHEFIRVSGHRLVRGIVETSYRIAQLDISLDRAFFAGAGPEAQASAQAAMLSMFDLARADLLRAIDAGLVTRDAPDGGDRPMMTTRTLVRTTNARAVELRNRLVDLLREYDDDVSPAELTVGILISLHPMADPDAVGRPARKGAR